MKIKILLFIATVFFICCNNNEREKDETDSNSNKVITNDSENETGSNSASILIDPKTKKVILPFGSGLLENIKLPSDWDETDSTGLLTAEGKTFNKISQYYIDVNGNSTGVFKNTLEIKSFSVLNLSSMADFNASLLQSVSNIKYQLPDMGPYQCFYAYNVAKEVPHVYVDSSGKKKEYDYENTPEYYDSTGNLILYNKISKTAKVINIYSQVLIPFQVDIRLFYINSKNQIMLFRYLGEEIYGSLSEEYRISVKENGEVEIINLSK